MGDLCAQRSPQGGSATLCTVEKIRVDGVEEEYSGLPLPPTPYKGRGRRAAAVIHSAVFAFCNVKTPKERVSERASEVRDLADPATEVRLTDV